MIFLVAQAAYLLESLHGQEGVALAYFGQVPAVQQLQELDCKLDIANASVPRFHFRIVGAGLSGLLLDAALDGLDFVDFTEAQIFAVHKRLDGEKEALAELEIAGNGTNLD